MEREYRFEREYTVHHMWWNRAWYKAPILKSLRNHPLSKNALYAPIHRDLHAELRPPPKPSPEMAMGAILLLDELRDAQQTDPVNVHLALSEHFLEQDSTLAGRIGHHLLMQAGFVREGLRYEKRNTGHY